MKIEIVFTFAVAAFVENIRPAAEVEAEAAEVTSSRPTSLSDAR